MIKFFVDPREMFTAYVADVVYTEKDNYVVKDIVIIKLNPNDGTFIPFPLNMFVSHKDIKNSTSVANTRDLNWIEILNVPKELENTYISMKTGIVMTPSNAIQPNVGNLMPFKPKGSN